MFPKKYNMRGKKGFEMSFAWLFAIVAGAFILFSAIYATINLTRSSQYAGNTILVKQLGIIFNPLETGIASGKSTSVSFVDETRIYNRCYRDGSFGSQGFSLSQKSGVLKEWPESGAETRINNKYVFSEKLEQGKKIYFFSKPFEMPFKVSEVIFLTTREFCFKNAPDYVEDEVSRLNLGNIKLDNCTGEEVEVCFDSSCEISVYPTLGYTIKNGETLNFEGSLMYASIFSDPEIYECNVERLMKRIQQLAYLYRDEVSFISTRGCGDAMSSSVVQLATIAQGGDSSSLGLLAQAAENLDSQNSAAGGCRIY